MRVNVIVHDQILRQELLPNIRAICNCHNGRLQQHGALAKNTINFLHRENITFTEPDMWSQRVRYYAIWSILSNKKCIFVANLQYTGRDYIYIYPGINHF